MSGTDPARDAGDPPSDALSATLGAALAGTVRSTGATIGGLFLTEEAQPVLRLVAVCGVPSEFTVPWQQVPLRTPGPLADAVREERLVWIGSQPELARRYPRVAASLPHPFAVAALPLTGAHRCWGALVLLWATETARQPSSRERGHMTSHARRLTRLLEDAPRPPELPSQPRLVTAAGRRRTVHAELAAADYAERLPEGSVALDLEGRITYLSSSAARLLGRDAELLLGARPWQALPWLDDPVYEDHYRTAVIARAPRTFTALRPPDHWLTFEMYPDDSGISVRVRPGAEKRPAAAPPAGGPAQVAAPTGRLYQLVHVATTLTEAVGVDDLVGLLADHVLPAFGAQGLVLSAADAGRLKIIGCRGYPADAIDRLDGLPLETDLTPAGQVLATGVPAFYSDPGEMARRHPRAPHISGKRAWAFLPLGITGRPVGCCVLSYERPHAFGSDERAVLTSLAVLIAQALDRARLYDSKQRLAQELQRNLLPRTLPALPGLDVAARYLPAGHGLQIGGDFYDLLRLGDTTAAAVIGDVEGHNIAAAALMGQVRTAIHSHATAGASPDRVLACTNRLLTDLESDLLVSCLYVHLDLARNEVALASAGHMPPLLRQEPGLTRALRVDPGPLLGVDPRARYPVTTDALPPEAVLALYTDGLVEVRGVDTAETVDGLARRLAGTDEQDLEKLIDVLIERTRPTGRHTDDIAVLLLRANGGRG